MPKERRKLREVLAVVDERGNTVWKGVGGMNSNEAVGRIKFMLDVGGSDGFTSADKEALNMAINALSAEITAPPKSNADRIRQMTDEELANFLIEAYMNIYDFCASQYAKNQQVCEQQDCTKGILAWLKQEVREDAAD